MTECTEQAREQKRIYTPTELRQEFGVTARALRFYEAKGLLNPARAGLARNYNRQDRARLALILKGKRFGFTLQEIKGILELYSSDDGGARQRRVALQKMDEQADFLRQQIDDMTLALVELKQTCDEMRQEDDAPGSADDPAGLHSAGGSAL